MKIVLPFLFMLILLSCRAKEKSRLVLYKKENPVEIKVNSSCKQSTFYPLKNEEELKEKIRRNSEGSFKELKLKGSNSLKRSNYRINKTELVITENCASKATDGKSIISLHQLLVLENINTKDLVEFSSDTTIIDQRSLNQAATLIPQMPEIEKYIPILTKVIFLQAKIFFKPTK